MTYRQVFSQLRGRQDAQGAFVSCYYTTPVFEALDRTALPPRLRVHRLCLPHFRWGQDYAEPGLLEQVGMALLPSVNADERDRLTFGCPWYLRTNARGVDLNRNFDADWQAVDRNYGFMAACVAARPAAAFPPMSTKD